MKFGRHTKSVCGANAAGYKRGKPKDRWISDKTWQSVHERKSIKMKKSYSIIETPRLGGWAYYCISG